MANKIILKKSSVAAKAPVAGDLDFGELAINYTDSKLYFKKADGNIDAFTTATAAVTSVGGNIGAITDTQLLTSIKNVDGAGSGLDADLLDGNHASAFYLASNPNGYTSNTGTVTSVGATSPLVSSGGNTPSLSIPAATSSVNGYMSAAYASKLDGIAAGATNVTNNNQLTNGAGYITTSGARSALSFTAGSGAYNSSTGVITIPTNNNQLTNGAGYTTNTGTVTSVSGTGGYGGLTLSGTVTSSGNLTLGGTPTGTWPISVSGNAATATSADQIDSWAFANSGNNVSVNADTLDSNGITYYTAGVPNFTGNASDGALYSQAYSSSWQHQIAGDYRSGQIAVRGKNSGTWQAWRTVLDSSNYTGYAVSTANNSSLNSDTRNTRGVTRLYRRDDNSDYSVQTYWTGSYWRLYGYNGDSGHADTHVGYADSAGTAGSVAWSGVTSKPSNIMYYQGFTLDANTMDTNATGFTYANNAPTTGPVARFSTGGSYDLWLNAPYIGGNNLYFRTRNGDAGSINSWRALVSYGVNYADSIYATIYYDNNDTGYYIDPASTSVLNRISTVRTNDWLYIDNNYGHSVVGAYSSYRYQGVFAMGDAYKLPADGTTTGNLYGMAWSHPNAGGTAANLNSHGLLLLQNGGFMAALSTNGTFSADVRGTIFYDYSNTGYYVDPNAVSYLYGLTLAGGSYFRPQNWIQMDGSYGMYWPNTNGAHIEGNTLSTYGSIAIRGVRNGWRGIHFYEGGYTPHIMFDGNGNGGIYHESGGRWASYYSYGADCWGFGTSTTNSAYNLYAPKGIYSGGRVDGTIFYDSNNTGYYTDPASNSNFNITQTISIRETRSAIAASAIDVNSGNYFTKTITAATTFTVNAASSGSVSSFILELTNAGSAAITWFSGVKWAGGTAPALTSAGVDILGFYTHDGGTTWRGMVLAKDSK